MPAAPILTVSDVPLSSEAAPAPAKTTPTPETRLARSMTDYLHETAPDSGAEALALLRRVFPNSPLTLRVAALAAVMRTPPYSPR